MLRIVIAAGAMLASTAVAFAGGGTGPYAGVVMGYGVAKTPYAPTYQGPMVGFRLGYEAPIGSLVFGIEGQAIVARFHADQTTPAIITTPTPRSIIGTGATIGTPLSGTPYDYSTANSDWSVDLTGRLGRDVNGYDLYFLGGLTAANNRMHDQAIIVSAPGGPSTTSAFPSIDASAVYFGIVGGAGVETALSDHLSIFAEARYHHYFSTAYSFSNGAVGIEPFSAASISTGLDWHF